VNDEKPLVNLYGRVEKDRVGTAVTFTEPAMDVDVDSMMALIEGWVESLMDLHTRLAAGEMSKTHSLH
jgi:hypothetical protein